MNEWTNEPRNKCRESHFEASDPGFKARAPSPGHLVLNFHAWNNKLSHSLGCLLFSKIVLVLCYFSEDIITLQMLNNHLSIDSNDFPSENKILFYFLIMGGLKYTPSKKGYARYTQFCRLQGCLYKSKHTDLLSCYESISYH